MCFWSFVRCTLLNLRHFVGSVFALAVVSFEFKRVRLDRTRTFLRHDTLLEHKRTVKFVMVANRG